MFICESFKTEGLYGPDVYYPCKWIVLMAIEHWSLINDNGNLHIKELNTQAIVYQRSGFSHCSVKVGEICSQLRLTNLFERRYSAIHFPVYCDAVWQFAKILSFLKDNKLKLAEVLFAEDRERWKKLKSWKENKKKRSQCISLVVAPLWIVINYSHQHSSAHCSPVVLVSVITFGGVGLMLRSLLHCLLFWHFSAFFHLKCFCICSEIILLWCLFFLLFFI